MIDVRFPPVGTGGVLSQPVLHEDSDGMWVQIDDAVFAAGGLGPAERQPPVVLAADVAESGECCGDGEDLPAHDQAASLNIDVCPRKPERFPAPKSCCGEQLERRTERVLVRMVEESPELLWLPRPHMRTGR